MQRSLKIVVRLYCSRNTCKTTENIKTAGVIVIGDEILKGDVADTNSHFIAKELHGLGVELKKISVIGDCVDEVSDEVKAFSKRYDYVVTSGGIGPTHDDITYEAVAKAFNEPLAFNPVLKELCKSFYNTDDENAPGMKLALVPKSAKLTFRTKDSLDGLKYPNVSVGNVFIFPGIPQLLRKSFSHLCHELFKSSKVFYTKVICFNIHENELVKALNVIVAEFPTVQCGSYPIMHESTFTVKITLESYDSKATGAAYEKLLSLVPKDKIVPPEKCTTNDS